MVIGIGGMSDGSEWRRKSLLDYLEDVHVDMNNIMMVPNVCLNFFCACP